MRFRELALSCILFLITGGMAEAQDVQTRIRNMAKQLSTIEAALERIERSRKIDTRGEDLDMAIDRHIEETKDTFAYVMSELKTSKGAGGSLQAAKEFEKAVREHQRRAQRATEQIVGIEVNVRSGRIKVERSVLATLSGEELREFRQGLIPEADREYKNVMPDLFVGDVPHASDADWLRTRPTLQTKAEHSGPGLLQRVLDGIIPPAEAASVVICVGLCPGTACLSCVAAASVAGGAAVVALNKCLKDCGKCRAWLPWRCWCRTGCWAGFLLFVA